MAEEKWPEIIALLLAYMEQDKRLDIWRRYPDITPEEDAYTDAWACELVSAQFAAFARTQGWETVIISAEEAVKPYADYHVWVRVIRPGINCDVDWTARQFHNLDVEEGHDPRVMGQPFPLIWSESIWGDKHPLAGEFRKVQHLRPERDYEKEEE